MRAVGLAEGLALAAAPTFAAMALMTAVGSDPTQMICAAAGASPLVGMAPMYLLMSLFHAGPWLRIAEGYIARRR